MNIHDKELSVVVPKERWAQIEQEIKETNELIQTLLVLSDNVVIVKLLPGRASVMNHRYRFEEIHYANFEIKGGGEIIQNLLKFQERYYNDLLRRVDYSRWQDNKKPCSDNKDTYRKDLEILVMELREESAGKSKQNRNLWVACGLLLAGLILSAYL